ncbi:cyclin-dependent kinase G1-like [Durio zibethinus]|uniref:Cyclin-dependent kinase G1-like n=1 Tax=Durio zibethinus TaxID=66656 RepID=A0A6P6ALE7_DURZI|nr:cyclin-dependent kinase G1-like [Durio zibethinus]
MVYCCKYLILLVPQARRSRLVFLNYLRPRQIILSNHKYNLLRRKLPAVSFTGSPVLSDVGFDLLNRLFTYDPEKVNRITNDALNHDWFHELSLPKSKEFFPTFPSKM